MKLKSFPQLSACALLALTALRVLQLSAADAGNLPVPWKHQDIGAVEVKGDAAFADGVFTVKGTLDTWGTNDGFHFVFQRFTGDGEIVARIMAVQNTQNHAKAGVMFRESLTAEARHAAQEVTPVDGVQFLVRAETGDKTTSAKTGLNKGVLPYWVKLVRTGNIFTGYESTDGRKWTATGTNTVSMSKEVYAGLVTSSHQKTVLCEASFDKVELSRSDAK